MQIQGYKFSPNEAPWKGWKDESLTALLGSKHHEDMIPPLTTSVIF